jgi:hypothetical protein
MGHGSSLNRSLWIDLWRNLMSVANDRKWRNPAEHRARFYAELSILNYRKSRALGNWLGIVSGSA